MKLRNIFLLLILLVFVSLCAQKPTETTPTATPIPTEKVMAPTEEPKLQVTEEPPKPTELPKKIDRCDFSPCITLIVKEGTISIDDDFYVAIQANNTEGMSQVAWWAQTESGKKVYYFSQGLEGKSFFSFKDQAKQFKSKLEVGSYTLFAEGFDLDNVLGKKQASEIKPFATYSMRFTVTE